MEIPVNVQDQYNPHDQQHRIGDPPAILQAGIADYTGVHLGDEYQDNPDYQEGRDPDFNIGLQNEIKVEVESQEVGKNH